ncbi:anti-sigma factor family protein [Streptomyces albipurpureus]|uniref:Zf-HC2 domain-containing protein n=1 Tax=Streptomyces albipurpureus TaxID=2897419 RepID=A0ABT0UWG9_9ACTN|nr:zf-HC2 domain-containing protein [Streptomyces sp. CWNU-1]MCM2392289.1 zf-HC2 domain-containing protein [Streptomyces sp. CWNU-1]
MTTPEPESVHDAVGAYVLGILDDADVPAFEMHLAGCDICATHLEEFAGMEPMLAMLAEVPSGPFQASGPNVVNLPGPRNAGWSDPFQPPAGYQQSPPGYAGASSGYQQSADGYPPSSTEYPQSAAGQQPARPIPIIPAPPGPKVLNGLLDEVAAKRAARRRRGMYLIAAAAALIIGGPAAAVLATADDSGAKTKVEAKPTSPAEDAFFNHMDEKIKATDTKTNVSATVGMEKKGWGTHTVLELKNVKGPLKCSLIAISKTGEEEVVTSWAVPKWGYGIVDSPNKSAKNPLYVHGGAAMERNEIDRFEVRTFDNQKLVEIDA